MMIFKPEMIKMIDYRKIREDGVLNELNDKLIVIEKNIRDEKKRLTELATLNGNNSEKWFEDFEVRFEISFYLAEDDPEYKEDQENILFTLEEIQLKHYPDLDEIFFLEKSLLDNDRFMRAHYCYLFNFILEALAAQWSNIYRIGGIWLDIKLELQAGYEVRNVNPVDKTTSI